MPAELANMKKTTACLCSSTGSRNNLEMTWGGVERRPFRARVTMSLSSPSEWLK